MDKQKQFPPVLYVWREEESDGNDYYMETEDINDVYDGEVAEYRLIRTGTKSTSAHIKFHSGKAK